jgi:hypothetical protein
MPVISSYRSLSSFTCSPHDHRTIDLLLPRHRSGVATCVDAPYDARRIFGSVQPVVRADMCAASDAAVHTPRAGMGVRGSGPIQNHVLGAPVATLVFLIPSR